MQLLSSPSSDERKRGVSSSFLYARKLTRTLRTAPRTRAETQRTDCVYTDASRSLFFPYERRRRRERGKNVILGEGRASEKFLLQFFDGGRSLRPRERVRAVLDFWTCLTLPEKKKENKRLVFSPCLLPPTGIT